MSNYCFQCTYYDPETCDEDKNHHCMLLDTEVRAIDCCPGWRAIVSCYYSYIERTANEEIDDTFFIREDDSDWREPLVEV